MSIKRILDWTWYNTIPGSVPGLSGAQPQTPSCPPFNTSVPPNQSCLDKTHSDILGLYIAVKAHRLSLEKSKRKDNVTCYTLWAACAVSRSINVDWLYIHCYKVLPSSANIAATVPNVGHHTRAFRFAIRIDSPIHVNKSIRIYSCCKIDLSIVVQFFLLIS